MNQRQAELFDRGPAASRKIRAPFTPERPGSGPPGERCGTCANCFRKNGRYPKCALTSWASGSASTDIRTRYPACLCWRPGLIVWAIAQHRPELARAVYRGEDLGELLSPEAIDHCLALAADPRRVLYDEAPAKVVAAIVAALPTWLAAGTPLGPPETAAELLDLADVLADLGDHRRARCAGALALTDFLGGPAERPESPLPKPRRAR